jgi:SAM-dependent methyltransferase
MTGRNSVKGAHSDYRTSHIHKGSLYDDDLYKSGWNRYLCHQEQMMIGIIIKRFFENRPIRCMDFACGTGRITIILERLAKECIGVDLSPSMLEKAKEKCRNTTFFLCDITKNSPDLGIFDLITAFRFFGHAQNILRTEVLLALSGYLADDGYLVLNNHRNPSAPQNLLLHLTGGETNMDLTVAKLRRQVETCGFRMVDLYGIGGWSLRHRWQSWAEYPSERVRLLERVTRHRILAPFAPDWIAVLKKSGLNLKREQGQAGHDR